MWRATLRVPPNLARQKVTAPFFRSVHALFLPPGMHAHGARCTESAKSRIYKNPARPVFFRSIAFHWAARRRFLAKLFAVASPATRPAFCDRWSRASVSHVRKRKRNIRRKVSGKISRRLISNLDARRTTSNRLNTSLCDDRRRQTSISDSNAVGIIAKCSFLRSLL